VSEPVIYIVGGIPIGVAAAYAGKLLFGAFKSGQKVASFVTKDQLADELRPYAKTESVDLKLQTVEAKIGGLDKKVDDLKEDIRAVALKTDQVLNVLASGHR
jgi:hypothetical protein